MEHIGVWVGFHTTLTNNQQQQPLTGCLLEPHSCSEPQKKTAFVASKIQHSCTLQPGKRWGHLPVRASTDGHMFSVWEDHSLVCISCVDLQHVSVWFCVLSKKKKSRALQDKTTAPVIMQICFGKWVQVVVFSLVWCVPQSTGNTQFQQALPQRWETNFTTAYCVCCSCLCLCRESEIFVLLPADTETHKEGARTVKIDAT